MQHQHQLQGLKYNQRTTLSLLQPLSLKGNVSASEPPLLEYISYELASITPTRQIRISVHISPSKRTDITLQPRFKFPSIARDLNSVKQTVRTIPSFFSLPSNSY
jgi:hypothetical protein